MVLWLVNEQQNDLKMAKKFKWKRDEKETGLRAITRPANLRAFNVYRITDEVDPTPVCRVYHTSYGINHESDVDGWKIKIRVNKEPTTEDPCSWKWASFIDLSPITGGDLFNDDRLITTETKKRIVSFLGKLDVSGHLAVK